MTANAAKSLQSKTLTNMSVRMNHFPSLNHLMRMYSRTLITIHRAHITSSRLPTVVVVVVVVMIRAPMFGIE